MSPPEALSTDPDEGPPPDDCRSEIKLKKSTHTLITVDNNGPQLSRLINLEDYSSSHGLFHVTALVLEFVHNARRGTNDNRPLSATDTLITSNDLWIKDSQSQLKNDGRFPLWKCQLGLFRDESDVWRCSGRMSNSSLHLAAQTPTLLHCLATLEDEYLIPWLEVTAAGVLIIPGFLCFLGLAEVVCNEVSNFGEAFLHEHDVRDDALRGLWARYP